jgi:hypothetical protein
MLVVLEIDITSMVSALWNRYCYICGANERSCDGLPLCWCMCSRLCFSVSCSVYFCAYHSLRCCCTAQGCNYVHTLMLLLWCRLLVLKCECTDVEV